MAQQYPPERIPGTLERLIEAWRDHGEAERQLEEYQRTNPRPAIPREPLSVDSLQDYHRERMEYEAELKEVRNREETSHEHHTKLQDEVRLFLPKRRRLFYEYQGAREDLAERYIVQDTGRRMIIEPYDDARRRGSGAHGRRP
jgi:hypothetical protein